MKLDKDISHIHLLDAFEKSKICPICELSNSSVAKYIDDLLYECVNEPGIRKKLIHCKGLCAFHGELFVRHGDALGIAIIYEEQIKLLLENLKSLQGFFWLKKEQNLNDWLEHPDCMVCHHRKETEERYIETFVHLFDDEVMQNSLKLFPGLCIRHLLMSIALLRNNDQKSFLIELHITKYSSLLADLKEFCRKNDYRFKDEPIGKEGDSWKRAVYIASGKIL